MSLYLRFLTGFLVLMSTKSGFSQYSLLSLDQHQILLTWDYKSIAVQKIEVDQGEVTSFWQNDSLFIYIGELNPAELVNLSVTVEELGALETKVIPFVSKSTSSGNIDVYFNLAVNSNFQKSDYTPAGTSFAEIQSALRKVIRQARKTIDLAAYNTNEIFLVNELIDASNRGVRIRVITDDETTNSGWSGGVPFPILKGNVGSGLMHNKFLIIDAYSPDSSLVIMGSMNFTSNQMRKDPNHLLFIQDQSLAKAYTLEFEEMWGSELPIPNVNVSKFGSNKTKNTPTDFIIGDIPARLYFSPSDGTTEAMIREVKTAQSNLLLALMIFTNWELRDVVSEVTAFGINTRWIVDDDANSAGVINAIKQAGGNVLIHNQPDIFHHKYAIIDEDAGNPILITGSHNWTFSAETINDENTIIFFDDRLSNIFRQEFEARWGGLNSSLDSHLQPNSYLPFPNPNHGMLHVDASLGKPILFNSVGQEVSLFKISPDLYEWKGEAGVYFLHLDAHVYKLIRI